ncbi:hypothetical protein FA10DRAFT_265694 [Acaromyces ingoldii]|uniref:Cupin 2 conserved barrel domain-containing protein n=1 Tax=Acaromyces ingoldii TaxID=215250 RepID=A0A316YRW5_9BASI|nr:hypothetical protein FA10DRAFT_265694 [Acaromyces ingoldii]PWN91862.1 hypothetical protein FA10DRAFT_265694 [Acaromyces ingoldii]
MPPLQRPHIDNEGRWHFFNGDLVAWKVSSDGDSFTSGQIFKAKSPHSGMGRKSTATPPYHTHLYQTETFDVQSGTLCYLIDGKEGKLLAGQKTSIPPHRPHTFWSDPETGEDLIVNITVRGGPNAGFDEDFVRNFYGYLSSQVMQKSGPNPFQMLRLLDDADVILADVPLGLGRWVNIIFGRWIGGYLLGYPTRFKIFSE